MADPGGRPRISGRPSKYFWRYRGPPMPQTTRATIERLRFQAALHAPSWQAPNAIRHHPNTRMRIDRLGRQGLSRRWATHVRRSRPPSWVINVHSGKGVFTRPGPETEVAVSQMQIGGSSMMARYLVVSLSYRVAIRRISDVVHMTCLIFML